MSIYCFGSAVTRNSISALTKCFAVALLGAGAILAASCPTATLDVYVGFGANGCTIGALTFSQFKYFAFGNTILPQTDLLITPIVDSNGTGFTITPQGAPPWFATFFGRTDVEIQYIAASTNNPMNIFDRLYTEVNGSATPQGFDQVVELYCPRGTTLPPDPTCPGFPNGVQYLFVGLGSASATFPRVHSIAVLKNMDANALQGGNATITGVKNQLFVRCACTT